MAKIDYIKLSKVRDDGTAELIVRLYVTKAFRPQFKSNLFINPKRFVSMDATDRCRHYRIDIPRKGKLNYNEVKDLELVEAKFATYLKRLQRICDVTEEKHKDELTTEWISNALRLIDKTNPNIEDISYSMIATLIEQERKEIEDEKKAANKRCFFDLMADYRDNAKKRVNGKREGDKSEVWKKNFNVLVRALHRYEMFVRLTDRKRKDFTLDIDTIDHETLEDIESYLRKEHSLLEEYPKVFAKFPATTDTKRRSPKPKARGNNTIAGLFNKLRAFFHWLNEKDIITNDPFKGFEGTATEHYGTPYYITLEERNAIADFDLSAYPALEAQRDIFIFQCCIGCRVSDLLRLTSKNVINGFVEYIPTKTKGDRPKVVRVPLNGRATEILHKWQRVKRNGKLLPFITAQKYNDAIKEIFTRCGITRLVTILDSVTGMEVQRPINEVASSHMARRCFVGNLYKQVKDPNLIAPMSGHSEGSRAFARYREIDDEMKKEIVKLID